MITANYSGGLELTDTIALSDTSITDIYTAPDNQDILTGFAIANNNSSAIIVTCYINKGSDVIVFKTSVTANETIVQTDMPLKLRAGYIFKAKAATGGYITVTPIITRFDTNESVHR
ncbi:hypothetical protein [Lentilitoribacter sp. Alg239-R112]|uniref:hypothetical protein n=1 Tax=Lentilitoribacter sp. Alg239-R112 TaxID=2305987 RepID=UPI0013A6C42F|nr:hypothetical protein [Lentilitoribacter sp. Alg239-R112]